MNECTACHSIQAFGILFCQVWHFGDIFQFPTEKSIFVYKTNSYGKCVINLHAYVFSGPKVEIKTMQCFHQSRERERKKRE